MAIDVVTTYVNRSRYKLCLSIPFHFKTSSIDRQSRRGHCVNLYAMMDEVSVFAKKNRESAN